MYRRISRAGRQERRPVMARLPARLIIVGRFILLSADAEINVIS
jgi:hypothetical protein